MIYSAGVKGPYKVPGVHDPDRIRTMVLRLKPSAWVADTFYNKTSEEDYDIVVPTSFKGLAHKVDNPGVSHATTEPIWSRTVGGTTTDYQASQTEGLTWTAVPYTFMPHNVDISSITATATAGATLVSSSHSSAIITVTIDAVPTDAAARTTKSFQVHVHYVKSDGDEDDITLEFKLDER